MRNILKKNHTQNMVEKLFPNSYLKNLNGGYLWINNLTFYTVSFYFMLSCGLSKYILKLSCRPLAFTSCKAFFKKQKRGLELVSLPHCLHVFLRKIFILLYSITWPNFIVWLPFLRKILGNVFCNCLLTRLWRHKFWI